MVAERVANPELKPIRVLVVDDSATVRAVLARNLAASPGIEVVGRANDGLEAIEAIKQLRPDVVTLDIEMPRLDGLAALERIMQECPTRVVMVSTLTRQGAEATLRALDLGAVDFIQKPTGAGTLAALDIAAEVAEKVRGAAAARIGKRTVSRGPGSLTTNMGTRSWRKGLVVIGSSTGGPPALREVISHLPADLGLPVVVVQHMPPGFTKSMADRLNGASPLRVLEAEEGSRLQVGTVLIAPGGMHMTIDTHRVVHLNEDPPECGVRPSVNVTMESAARVFGPNVVSAVLTGMGNDGTRGAGLIRDAGGIVITEDESTCVVYGMPRSVFEAGYSSDVKPLHQVADAIVQHSLV
jgi:two-component system, chemotaxis family, protein-glutamate methylesterase/glutaminase